MFDPLSPSTVLQGLGRVLRTAAGTDTSADGLVRSQLMLGASVARLLATELEEVSGVRRALVEDIERLLRTSDVGGWSAEAASAAQDYLGSAASTRSQDADEPLVRLLRSTRDGGTPMQVTLGREVRAAIKRAIEAETTAYAKETRP